MMRALTFQGTEIVEARSDVADPQLQSESDVIVAVHRAGICGSDLHQYHGREPVRPETVPGHEFVGEVVAVGSQVRGFRIGESVFAPFTTSCGECFSPYWIFWAWHAQSSARTHYAGEGPPGG